MSGIVQGDDSVGERISPSVGHTSRQNVAWHGNLPKVGFLGVAANVGEGNRGRIKKRILMLRANPVISQSVDAN